MARLLFLLLILSPGAFAQEPPALDERTRNLAHELRCLVCQNQTLADSNAPLAIDLRKEIRSQLAAGKTEDDVIDFMVARYGDFVLYRPPFKATTAALWFGPFILLVIGAWILWRRVTRRRTAQPQLSEAERARAARLLE